MKQINLISLCPKCKSRIFTVYEINGLEYKNIYCYNILSSNYNVWKGIFEGRYRNDESKRYYFMLQLVELVKYYVYMKIKIRILKILF